MAIWKKAFSLLVYPSPQTLASVLLAWPGGSSTEFSLILHTNLLISIIGSLGSTQNKANDGQKEDSGGPWNEDLAHTTPRAFEEDESRSLLEIGQLSWELKVMDFERSEFKIQKIKILNFDLFLG